MHTFIVFRVIAMLGGTHALMYTPLNVHSILILYLLSMSDLNMRGLVIFSFSP